MPRATTAPGQNKQGQMIIHFSRLLEYFRSEKERVYEESLADGG